MKKILLIALIFLGTILTLGMTNVYAYWGNIQSTQSSSSNTITIGEWITTSDVLPFDPNTDYQVGNTFSFDGAIWEITGSWFNEDRFLRNNGTLNTNYVRPYGPIQEVTNEWRSYNTYYTGDVVTHLGYPWTVRHEGANGVEPGQPSNAWDRISVEWFAYNTYFSGDIVEYNNKSWRALQEVWNKTPGVFAWAWEEII